MALGKVVWIIDDLGLGGAQRQLVEIAKVLNRTKFPLEIISLSTQKTDYEKELRDQEIPLTLIDQTGKWSWRTFHQLAKKLHELKPDIVQTWLFTADLYGRLAALRLGIRRIISAIRNTIDDMPWHYRIANRILAFGTTAVTINAESIRKGLVSFLGIPNRKIRTIYNGIQLQDFPMPAYDPDYLKSWNIPAGSKMIAMAARMAPQKDYFSFLKAAKTVSRNVPEAYFLLIGDGPLKPQIEALIESLGLKSKVKLLGARRDLWQILNHIDLFVLASHFEGCSNVIMEAMTAAKPVVATHVGGNGELVENGKSGILTADNDVPGLAEAMLKLLRDPDESRRMGEAGRKRVENLFTIQKTVRDMESLYQELMEKK